MPNEPKPIQPTPLFDPSVNTGFIEAAPRLTDYIAGEESGIVYQEFLHNADWEERNYLPNGEQQFGVYFDSLNCTNYGGTNVLDTQLNALMDMHLMPPDAMKFLRENEFLDKDGKVETGERFAGYTSGTTRQGNYLDRICNAYRHYGLTPQRLWDFPYAQKHPVFDWDDYYAIPPQKLFDLGKQSLTFFDIQWEWVAAGETERTPLDKIEKHTKQAPLLSAHPTCSPWNTAELIRPCGTTKSNHATMVHKLKRDSYVKDFDSYNPWNKKLALNYPIPWLIKLLIFPKTITPQPQPAPFRYHFKHILLYGQRSDDIKALQQALKIEGFFPLKVQTTGYYGNITATAVYKFQIKHSVAPTPELNSLQGRRVGTKTLAQLNKLFDKKSL